MVVLILLAFRGVRRKRHMIFFTATIDRGKLGGVIGNCKRNISAGSHRVHIAMVAKESGRQLPCVGIAAMIAAIGMSWRGRRLVCPTAKLLPVMSVTTNVRSIIVCGNS